MTGTLPESKFITKQELPLKKIIPSFYASHLWSPMQTFYAVKRKSLQPTKGNFFSPVAFRHNWYFLNNRKCMRIGCCSAIGREKLLFDSIQFIFIFQKTIVWATRAKRRNHSFARLRYSRNSAWKNKSVLHRKRNIKQNIGTHKKTTLHRYKSQLPLLVNLCS